MDEILDGRYRIKSQLGLGGMGTVYEAVDTKRFGKPVALKEIRIDVAKVPTQKQQEIFRQAFEREAKILTQLDYEAFPQVVDYFTKEDRQYLVMELIQGDDLEKQLRTRNTPFTLEDVLNFSDQLLDALDYLHTLKPPIIHRDIKPQNLKLTSRGKIKLLDFGIAKGSDVQANFTITNQTFLAATLHYSPIEQILRVLDPSFLKALMPSYGEKITKNLNFATDAGGDIYALGATLYHLTTNILPVDALKRALELWAGNSDPLPAPRQLNTNVPVAISEWILKSMEIDREMRFVSAIEMRKVLHLILEAEKLREEDAKKEEWLREQELLKNQERLKEQERLREQERLKEQERLEEQEKLRKERRQLEVERRKIEESRIANLKQLEEAKLLHLKEIEVSKERAEKEKAEKEKADLENQRRQKNELRIKKPENWETKNRNNEIIPAESPIINPFVTKPNAVQNPKPAAEHQQIDNSPVQIPKPTTGLSYLKPANRVSSQNENKQQIQISAQNQKAESERFPKPMFDLSQIPDAINPGKTIWAAAAASLIFLLIVFGILALRNRSDTSVSNSSDVALPAAPSGMVFIPGGEFLMGRDDGKNQAEKPAHKVSVNSFFIDQTEVTNEQYAEFVKAANYKPSTEWKNGTFTKGEEKLPVVGVNWEDASAYAKWAGKRLPTEEEWEYAAKGTNNFIYPWGNKWEDRGAISGSNAKNFSKVGSFTDKSPFGLYDMVGNAWEWTASDFKPYPNGKLPDVFNGKTNLKAIRGGSFDSGKEYSTTTYRIGWAATGAENYKRTGFRCVKDVNK